MSDLQGTPGEIEQPTFESEGSTHKANPWQQGIIVLSDIVTLVSMGYILFKMLDDDTIKLKTLWVLQKSLKALALIIGTAALLVEKQYNDYISTLH